MLEAKLVPKQYPVHLDLNLGDDTFPLADGAVLTADAATRAKPGLLAAHGWAIVG